MPNLSTKERLARVEGNLDQLVFETRQLHSELRENTEGYQQYLRLHEGRLRDLEVGAEQTRTHLRWMKAAWAAVQGAVVGWIGFK